MMAALKEESSAENSLVNALSIDVEDYFQVSAFEPHIDRSQWSKLSCRVEDNVQQILDILDEHHVKATFFTLGWIADRYPDLVREIARLGHEIASHGYAHVRVTQQNRGEFRQDIVRTKGLLEDTTGERVLGYRAASYSINESNLWAHEVLMESGHLYSSSIYPVRHDLYGIPDAPRFVYRPFSNADFLEIPISTIEINGHRLPCGGGGFFRLYPYFLSQKAVAYVNRVERQPAIFYFHPWEIDPGQPRIEGLSLKTRFRHYFNLNKTKTRLRKLLGDFHWSRMDSVFLQS